MREGLRVEAVTGGQVELLQPRTSLGDDLQTGFSQEVAARQLQADQAETTGLHEAEEERGRETGVKGEKENKEIHSSHISNPLVHCLLLSFCTQCIQG